MSIMGHWEGESIMGHWEGGQVGGNKVNNKRLQQCTASHTLCDQAAVFTDENCILIQCYHIQSTFIKLELYMYNIADNSSRKVHFL